MKQVAVIGAGALGTLLAVRFSRVARVVLVARDEATARAIRERGGAALEGEEPSDVELRAGGASLERSDAVIVAVKTYATPSLASLRPFVRAGTPIVSVQNGIDNELRLQAAFGPAARLYLAPTALGATLLGPGRARATGAGATTLGAAHPVADASGLEELVALWRAAGFAAQSTADIRPFVWAKLVANVAINPLTALENVPNGALLERPELRSRAAALAAEAAAVARALGIALPAADPVAYVEEVARATAPNRSSMLQDASAGRRTEIDALSGALVRYAELAGVDVPANRALLAEFAARFGAENAGG